MRTISVELGNGFFKTCKELQKKVPECAAKAERDAIKKGASALTDTKGGMPSIYNVKKKDLSQYIKTSSKEIRVRSSPFTMTHFAFTPKDYISQKGIPVKRRRKVSVTILKGHRMNVHAKFIANPAKMTGGSVLLWKRLRKGDTEVLRSVSAPQMARREEISNYVDEAMQDVMQKRMEHYIDRAAKALEGKG